MSDPHFQLKQAETLRQLQEQLQQVPSHLEGELLSTGFAPLDALLPGGGVRRGTLVEWLTSGLGTGSTSLALGVFRAACAGGRYLVIVDRRQEFYAPALTGCGLNLEQVLVLRPQGDAEERWAMDQTLRCQQVAGVLCRVEKILPRDFRRWQLAAEAGQSVGVLLRSQEMLRQPSWAQVRLQVLPSLKDPVGPVAVRLVRGRGTCPGQQVFLDPWEIERRAGSEA